MSSTESRLRDAYRDYSARRFEFVERDLAADVDWEIVGTPVMHVHTRGEVRSFFDELAQQFAAHDIAVGDLVESGDRIVAFVTHRFTRHDGGSFEVPAVHDWSFRDGQFCRLREVGDNLAFAVGAGLIPAEALAGAGAAAGAGTGAGAGT